MREVVLEALRGGGREPAQIMLSSEETRLAIAKAIAGEVAGGDVEPFGLYLL
ncbi:MAG: hypothetical protein QW598_01435 [Pyrobaculum sp.]